MRCGFLLAAAISVVATASGAQAQQWPTRPITMISPYPPGGTNDIVGRLFADKMGAKLGQPVVVENGPVQRVSSARSRSHVRRPTVTRY